MTTALDIVTRAMRKIGVSGEGEILEGETASEALDALNDMLHAWKLAGVDTEHTDIGMNDAFPLPPEYNEGTVYLLASRLSPNDVMPQAFDADDWFRKMQAAYLVIEPVKMTQFQRMPSQYVGDKRSRGY